jgi:hypothetical protein
MDYFPLKRPSLFRRVLYNIVKMFSLSAQHTLRQVQRIYLQLVDQDALAQVFVLPSARTIRPE